MDEGIVCSKCNGRGFWIDSFHLGASYRCDKCGGEGRLYPVTIEMKPVEVGVEVQSG